MHSDLEALKIYGFCVAWGPSTEPTWTMEQDEEYHNLPAHYPSLEEAIDRVAYLKSKGIKARALALLATPADTPEEFDSARVQRSE